jgi:hypothetical protein
MLDSWIGPMSEQEEENGVEFDATPKASKWGLIGRNCQVQILHKKSQDGTRTFANVVAVVPISFTILV